MFDDDWDDDESWADDESDIDEDVAEPCPECGHPVEAIADKCPACGYWLTDADRSAMGSSVAKPLWFRFTAAIVLFAFMVSLLAAVAFIF
jgi:hypothetical protein